MTVLIVDFPNNSNHQRKVKFSQMSEVHFFEAHAQSDKGNIWYYRFELDAMKIDYMRNIRALHQLSSLLSRADVTEKEIDSAEKVDFFGMEKFLTPTLIRERASRRAEYLRAVLEEHARQDKSGKRDACRQASISQCYSKWAAKRARTIGLIQAGCGMAELVHSVRRNTVGTCS